MMRSYFKAPVELQDLAKSTIDQAENALGMFFDAANNAMTMVPGPGTEISKQALSLAEQNMRATLEHARKPAQATDLQEVMQLQSDFFKSQFANAGDQMKKMTTDTMTAASVATQARRWTSAR